MMLSCQAILVLILGVTAAETATAAEAASAVGHPSPIAEELVAMDFQEVDLPDLIKFISEATKRNFVFDDRVRGKVSIVAPQKMSVEQAYAAFQSALHLAGFTTVTNGAITKIVPLEEAKTSAIETIGAEGVTPQSDKVVTELVTLKNLSVADALPIVERLVSPKGLAGAYTRNNTLVVVDSASNIQRIHRVLDALDVRTAAPQLHMLRLKNTSATELDATLQQLFGE